MNISERIKILRTKLSLNQNEFAKKLNMKRNSISLIENGKRNPSERTLLDISQRMGVNIDWLKYGEGEIFENENNKENKTSLYIEELTKKYNIGHYGKKLIEYYISMDKNEKKFTEKIIKNFVEYCNKENTKEENILKENILKIINDKKNESEFNKYYDLIELDKKENESIKKEVNDYERQLREEKKGEILSALQNIIEDEEKIKLIK